MGTAAAARAWRVRRLCCRRGHRRGRICGRQAEQVVQRVARRSRRQRCLRRRARARHVAIGVRRCGRQADKVSRAARGRQRPRHCGGGGLSRRGSGGLIGLQPGRPRLRLVRILPLPFSCTLVHSAPQAQHEQRCWCLEVEIQI